jgi:aspartyl-tRNA(Asn)/glutamyl-tRNA(Gln) amidotransferase subunit A
VSQAAARAAAQAVLEGPLARALRPFVRPVLHTGSDAGPLAGWTIALKDNIDVAGDLVEVGAPVLRGRRAPGTAPVVRRLLDAGAMIAGRTRVVELCWGSWGLNEHCGMARNPWDAGRERVPGGSSAGSAVAVAARLVRAALGSDTAGSIRMPSALCGITGFKPTWDTVPREGLVPLAPGYDSVGPMAVTAQDCAAVYAVMATTPVAPVVACGRIAVLPPESWPVEVEPAVQQALRAAADALRDAGFELVSAPPALDLAALTQEAGVLIAAQAWNQLGERFQADPTLFGQALQRRFATARDQSPADVQRAREARITAAADFGHWMAHIDALLMPTVPCVAPLAQGINESGSTLGHFTRWVNHVGGCAISLPAGVDPQGMPVAIQLVGTHGADDRVLGIAQYFQQITGWHRLLPPLDGFLR